VSQPARHVRIVRFGLFEADLAARELRREGSKVKLQDRPFEVLTILLERPNELITREEFRQKLWSADTFVDFDHSLNTSINRLRQALHDDADNPRFVATAGRLGYRFIAPTTATTNGNGNSNGHTLLTLETTESASVEAKSVETKFKTWRIAAVVGIAAILAAAVLAAHRLFPIAPARVVSISQLSHVSTLDPWGHINTDGARLFFLERAGDHWNLMQVPASGGDAEHFSTPYRNMKIVGISPDRSQFLAFTFAARLPDLPLWIVPIVGGQPRRVGNVFADDAAFTPDGRQIIFNGPDGIYLCERDGSAIRKLVSLPGRSKNPAWSRDGQRLRFTLFDDVSGASTIWEVAANGKNAHLIMPNWPLAGHERAGRWAPDGRYFFFESTQGDIQTVWALRDSANSTQQPVQLTFAPTSYALPVPDDTGRHVYVSGGHEYRQMVRYDAADRRFDPLLPALKLGRFAFSRDGSQLAYARDGALWWSRGDGSDPHPLFSESARITWISWNPDGQHLLLGTLRKGESSLKFFVLPLSGGTREEINLTVDANEPRWSADSRSIIYSRRFDSGVTPADVSGIYSLDLSTSQTTKIPGSENLIHPTPSPDGRFVAAITEERSEEQTRLEVFDRNAQSWTEIARGTLLSSSSWSHDSRYLYYQDLLAPEEPVFRFHLETRKTERVLDFASLLQGGMIRCGFTGLAPDDSILAVTTRGEGDLYRLDLELP
jgi:Tol biopolymer transport system component/DNA-binding winged helix-turn-helix (wHTH) protein